MVAPHGRNSKLLCFDAHSEYMVKQRRLPHWSQNRTACFITIRTADSIPKKVAMRWQYERTLWLESHGIDGRQPHWRRLVTALPIELQEEFEQRFVGRWSELLDECLGDCLLRRPELSEIVANSFHYFDGERYDLSDFVVMPNHAHILAGFYDAADMLRRCEAWKSFTAREINRLVGCKGRFWQSDGFDHLVRSPEQFAGLQRYIAENPVRARLKQGEFRHYSRDAK